MQWPALREYNDDAHEAEGEEQGDCCFAEALEGFFCSCDNLSVTLSIISKIVNRPTYPQIEKQNRNFDRVHAEIVYYLNRIRDLQRRGCLLKGNLSAAKAHAVCAEDVYGGEVGEGE